MRVLCGLLTLLAATSLAAEEIDFNRDIRSILSNNCFQCHGPDEAERKGGLEGLRLDTREGAIADQGGTYAIKPGSPAESGIIERIESDDPDAQMPPPESGKRLSKAEVEKLKQWIKQGANYAVHWSYAKPQRPTPPTADKNWCVNDIDRFIWKRLNKEGLAPTPAADRRTIIRRLSLDLTGLPPTEEEVAQFIADKSPNAYEQLVDRTLAKSSYGEHWARMWLDLARYADSAGYADDPPRTIWGFRDYVIESFNKNKPFDQFTIEQLAGDLLPEPTLEQQVATAFHRNTLTNNEGGTNDEEFRNVAIVDRVNTTFAVWMGTTMACAQCHTHKYDPISQREYFEFFAIFNSTEDADRRNEAPLVNVFSQEQVRQRAERQAELEQLQKKLQTTTPALTSAQTEWERGFSLAPTWTSLKGQAKSQAGMKIVSDEEGVVRVTAGAAKDSYALTSRSSKAQKLSALRLVTIPDEGLPGKGAGHAGGNFVVTGVSASWLPGDAQQAQFPARYVRIELPGKGKFLSLAEVEVFSNGKNVARQGIAKQHSTGFNGPPQLAIDGNTNGNYEAAKSTTHTAQADDPWWEVDLKSVQGIDRVVVWNRTDNNLQARLDNFRVVVLDEKRGEVWSTDVAKAPKLSAEFSVSGARQIPLKVAFADYAQPQFPAQNVLDQKNAAGSGWAVGGSISKSHTLTLIPSAPVELPANAQLTVTIDQHSNHANHTLGSFRLETTGDKDVSQYASIPGNVLAIVKKAKESRSQAESKQLSDHFLSITPLLAEQRERVAALEKMLADTKPQTTVPVMRELPQNRQRTTKIQIRGNYLVTGETVERGLPAVFGAKPAGHLDRLAVAKWLVSPDNPLTARVIANRYWEQIFGLGIVRSSEEFGSQGDLPTHPELLDWLATELIRREWNLKSFLKLIVMSATYRQASHVTPDLYAKDPENRLLARGPRFRLSAEMIRDQALFVSGLLSKKQFGKSVQPPRPVLGLRAAFGGSTDWKTSQGEDRYRRGLYTEWRRSMPYPSMATFDAPNREVCTVRRVRTNTPLQALVTLNDPVYIEAAQALARQIMAVDGDTDSRIQFAFRKVLVRPAKDNELTRIKKLYLLLKDEFAATPAEAKQLATVPLGMPKQEMNWAELAAWTTISNTLLNLDETLMKP